MLIKKFFFLMTTLCAFLITLSLGGINTSADYKNISPVYTTDSSGTYPTNKWHLTDPNQTDVINPQGGTSARWDNNTSWSGDPRDTTNSYIKYGTDTSNPDFAIRKYAKETHTPGLYDLYLNIRGNQQQDIKPIDIVLVVDMSGSMNSENNGGTDRVGAVRNGVKNFLTTIQKAGLGSYVNVGVVGFSSPDRYGMNYNGYVSSPIAPVSDQSHISDITNNVLNASNFKGGTFTQLGLQQAQEMLTNDKSDNKKEMILLTDGVPTYSYHVTTSEKMINGTVYGDTFNTNKIDEPGYTSKLGSSYKASGNLITDTWAATLGEARIAKDKNDEIHALGIQLTADNYWGNYWGNHWVTYLTADQIEQRMKLLVSDDSSGNPLYDSARSATDVTNYLNSQANDVIKNFNTINNGSISDPLGSQFNYNSDTADVKSVGSTPINSDDLPTAKISNGSLNVSNLNLGKGQEVQIHYQERINTESNNFVPDKWYQMNGATTLTPNGDDPSNQVDFGIPSAKAPGTTLTINKVWNMLPNDNNIPDSIDFTVNRGNTTDNNAWTQATGSLSKTQNWTGTFGQLIYNNSSVYLPKFNNQGQVFTYNLSEDNVAGFSSSINQVLNNFTITNNELGLAVQKFDSDGNSLTGSQFTLVKDTDNWQATDSSFTPEPINGNDNPIPIKPGYYELKESTAPVGYSLDTSTIKFQVTENGQWLDQQGTPISNNTLPSSDGFYVNNQNGNDILTYAKHDNIKPFTLTVNKIDKVTNQSVKGAEFQLTNSDTNQTIQPDESGDTATFTFNNLQPGNY
ncbi:SpaA isopeptide-forming pilin-related protein, partial [Lentilactobacillus parabuchneri]|uniref:SpaA isopeptide-forming pilin-related protein n=1 Tax=Lentilactobacillus parabuchneri TaxID=152331 RepID=UPI001CDBE64F